MEEAPRQKIVCPHCGSPLPPSAHREAVTCEYCGVSSVPGEAAAGTGRCPRCQGQLFEGRSGEVVVMGCGGCGGIWVDNENAQRALSHATTDAARLSYTAGQSARLRVATAPSGLSCPSCDRALVRVIVAPGDIEVDLCQDHGTWFDRHELDGILRARRPARPARPAPAPVVAPPGYVGAPRVEKIPDFRAGSSAQAVDVAQGVALVAGGVLAVFASLLTMGSDD